MQSICFSLMGALAGSRKRVDDGCKSIVSVSPQVDQLLDGHILKKPRVSSSTFTKTVETSSDTSSSWVASRIPLYPVAKWGKAMRIHAPVKNSRFISRRAPIDRSIIPKKRNFRVMGSFSPAYPSEGYEKVRAEALESFRGVKKQKEKEVIDLDSDNLCDETSTEKVKTVNFMGSKGMPGQSAPESSHEHMNVMIIDKGHSLEASVVTDEDNVIAKEDDVVTKVDDDSSLPFYKRLLDGIRKRYWLSDKFFQIELFHKHLQILSFQKEKVIKKSFIQDVIEEFFMPLTDEEEALVSNALSSCNRRIVLVTHANSNIDITGEALQCLRPGRWLNDEVINVYLELLKEREKRDPHKFLKCHFFNTFFYKKLINGNGGYNFQSVRRWTTKKKLGYALSDCEKIFVPIHKEVHWCLAIINKKVKTFQYLDSLRGVDRQVLNVLARYLVDEVKDKTGEDIDVSSWKREFVEDLPDQENGFDCGMFMIKYADFHSRDTGLCFSQEHMGYFRRRTAKEILKLRAE